MVATLTPKHAHYVEDSDNLSVDKCSVDKCPVEQSITISKIEEVTKSIYVLKDKLVIVLSDRPKLENEENVVVRTNLEASLIELERAVTDILYRLVI